MSRIEKELMAGENVMLRTRLSTVVYVWPAIASIFLFMLVLPLLWLVWKILERKTSEFVVTNKRIVVHVGLISSRSFELLLQKVESVGLDQGPLGKIMKSGTLTINGTGGSKEIFHDVENPFEFRKAVLEQIESRGN
jgi:uncharacterized membrane protein YdbT with pleckstrin-like domain